MAIWNGLTEEGAVVPIQVDVQGRVVVSGGGGAPSEVYGTAKASAAVGSNGSLYYSQNLACTRQSEGIYQLTFLNPLPDVNYAVVATIARYSASFLSVSSQTNTGFVVSVWTLSETNVDAPFSLAVFNGEPSEVTPLILPTSTVTQVKSLAAEVEKLKKSKNP